MALGVVFGQVLVNTPHPAMTAMTCPIERTQWLPLQVMPCLENEASSNSTSRPCACRRAGDSPITVAVWAGLLAQAQRLARRSSKADSLVPSIVLQSTDG